jgi:hypothetical protein
MDIFNQVFTFKTANEIWLKLHELHDGTSNVREQKHCLVLNEYNSFAIKDNDADIVRKIISPLPQQIWEQQRYENLSTMTLTIVIEKIAALEMSRKMGRQRSQLLQDHMLLHVMKGRAKKAPIPSSSSEAEEEEESDDDEDNQPSTSSSEDEETIRRVGKVMGMIRKINLMGVPL